MQKLSALIADDNKCFAGRVKSILEPAYEVLGIVEDGQVLVYRAFRLRPDIIVTDISTPKLSGLEAVRQIKNKGLQSKIIFITGSTEAIYAARALEAGALGYVLKHSILTELLVAIEKAVIGKKHLTHTIAAKLKESGLDSTESCFYANEIQKK